MWGYPAISLVKKKCHRFSNEEAKRPDLMILTVWKSEGESRHENSKTNPIKIQVERLWEGDRRGWWGRIRNCRTSKVVSPDESAECVPEWSPFDRTVIHLQVNNGKGRGIPIYLPGTRELTGEILGCDYAQGFETLFSSRFETPGNRWRAK